MRRGAINVPAGDLSLAVRYLANYALWYLCCYFCDAYVSIEISCPSSEANGFVTGFSDRIIVAKPFEIPGIRRDAVPQDFADVPKPKVTRKGA
jgi:hypothetical protein